LSGWTEALEDGGEGAVVDGGGDRSSQNRSLPMMTVAMRAVSPAGDPSG
jgi:hypothetical protein